MGYIVFGCMKIIIFFCVIYCINGVLIIDLNKKLRSRKLRVYVWYLKLLFNLRLGYELINGIL